MTQEQKARAYNEALERAKSWYIDAQIDFKKSLETLFPELKESEDEKIRKELITHCRNIRCVTEEGAEGIAKWIAWLEKQSKQKSAWSEEDERRLNIICDLLEDIPSHQNWIRTLKDRILTTKVTCDENDKEKLDSIINKASYNCCLKNDDISFLKSLKNRVQPQPKQEWGEEDERNLEGVIDEIKANKNNAPDYDLGTYDKFLDWLKSLKQRIGE